MTLGKYQAYFMVCINIVQIFTYGIQCLQMYVVIRQNKINACLELPRLIEIPPANKILSAKNKNLFFLCGES